MTRRNNSFLKRQKEQKRIERANAKRAERMARRKSRAERAEGGLEDIGELESDTPLSSEPLDADDPTAPAEDER